LRNAVAAMMCAISLEALSTHANVKSHHRNAAPSEAKRPCGSKLTDVTTRTIRETLSTTPQISTRSIIRLQLAQLNSVATAIAANLALSFDLPAAGERNVSPFTTQHPHSTPEACKSVQLYAYSQ
jgi:hypothetical protein